MFRCIEAVMRVRTGNIGNSFVVSLINSGTTFLKITFVNVYFQDFTRFSQLLNYDNKSSKILCCFPATIGCQIFTGSALLIKSNHR